MAEPTTSTFVTLLAAVGLVSLAPQIDGEALFGAVLGAWLVTSTKKDLKVWQVLGSLLLSCGVGYLFAPMALRLAPVLTSGGGAFACALLIIPLSIKAMVWIEHTSLWDVISRIRGGR